MSSLLRLLGPAVRAALSFAVALCLLIGPPHGGAAGVARGGGGGDAQEQKDGDPDAGKSTKDDDGKSDDGKEVEAGFAAASLPRERHGAGLRASGTLLPFSAAPCTLVEPATPQPSIPIPAQRLPRRLI